jgi:nucleoid DNA-binding protein
MTKADIAEKIQTKMNLSKKESAEMMEAVFPL